ncbi:MULTISPECIES: 3-keto-5-aminohexanoate cleavage protein [unclassified Sphingomonas]|uniref:3-keto-5-aminohexanoate cleavage protein n=1 Tax=unclassified Sphingomonas TaxID=196159 RepID=UPI0006FCA808|nr:MULTISPECIES: 3-keto-5-aminohexanoate cleavage protein [unclassified Sphingomonas]KRB78788.1 3-keto-5-aminohexanoate cleavage protein [Sphingomonas sp. Root710]KRB93698.1 3-keto-5-aminohexanoate cleavage protein [Sphingomonas sp. Root720]
MSKVMITVAPTGGMASKAQNPNLPTQPAEIAESVHRAFREGACIAALHARRPDDEATCNADIYRDINESIRARCDIVINNSTGGGSSGDMLKSRPDGLYESNFEERLKGCEAGAEMATFDGMTFVDVHGGKEIVVITPPSRCETLVKRIIDRGIKPEWEVFAPNHILQDVTRLIQKGYDKPPYYINMVLGADKGFQGAMPYSHDVLTAMIAALPPQSIFCVSAIGPAQLPATTQAMLLGGHVRVGLEDNNYYSRGELATNEQLVARTRRIAVELGLEIATPAEARDIIGLRQPVANVVPDVA